MISPYQTHAEGAEQFRQQFAAAISRIWTDEWSQRSEDAGYRWFSLAWHDTRRILERTLPGVDEPMGPYLRRVREQLKAIEWHYLFGYPDADGSIDVANDYARGIRTMVQTLNRMGLGLRERAHQA
jgi:hypothetical protein